MRETSKDITVLGEKCEVPCNYYEVSLLEPDSLHRSFYLAAEGLCFLWIGSA